MLVKEVATLTSIFPGLSEVSLIQAPTACFCPFADFRPGVIVVLSDGVVAEQGAPDALYARNGQYTHMVDLQTESQRWAI